MKPTLEKDAHALDAIYHPAHTLAFRSGEFLYFWGIHPPAAGARDRGGPDPHHPGPEPSLVLRHRRIDLIAPREDAALHVAGVESVLLEQIDGLRAAHAALAVGDDFDRGIEFV